MAAAVDLIRQSLHSILTHVTVVIACIYGAEAMREFFIKWFERIVNVVIILAAVGLALGGLVAIFASPHGIVVGLLQALLLWVFGGLYLILIGGAFYVGLGVYDSTRRTAAAVERLANKNN